MKKGLFFFLLTVTLIACKNNKKATTSEVVEKVTLASIDDSILKSAIIYEANIRQYSPEGTFNEFTKDIPELKKLGVKIIWLMPIFPISETKRKATGDKFVSDIKNLDEQKKYLGSYYAVSDFNKTNPDLGTKDDFRKLLKTAHENGIYVILDWVPNHTGWDHTWITTNPEYYTKNDKGEITDPLNEDGTSKGWTDVADLDYSNLKLQETMINEMKYWITKENVDGFRCDVAGSVPIIFWENAIPKLRAEKDIFMLAEAWEPQLLKGNLFDMAYAWEGHHIMNEIAQGKETVKDWDTYMKKLKTEYEENDILMNFITNHDENSWNGTVKERMGDAGETMLALSYAIPGMPLIYSGQEYDLNHRLKFFEKDSIPRSKGKIWPVLENLGKLKTANLAFDSGKNAASYKRITTTNDAAILVFKREKGKDQLLFIANMSDEASDFKMKIVGKMIDGNTGEQVNLMKDTTYSYSPWEYKILINH